VSRLATHKFPLKRIAVASAGAVLTYVLLSILLAWRGEPAAAQDAPAYPPEYRVEIRTNPRVIRPGGTAQLEITVRDPANGRSVMSFQPTHGQLFHIYIVSDDPSFFAHQHAFHDARGFMRVETLFPRAGLYRILSEFHPDGGREQSVLSSVVVGGSAGARPSQPSSNAAARSQASESGVQMRSDPEQPQPAAKTILFFTLPDADSLEKFEGEWGHLLAVSDDLIDVIHAEPFPSAPAGPGKPVQFNLYFPRARTYHLWGQFRTRGEVETASFDVTVKPLN
jgi:hypothetical protein